MDNKVVLSGALELLRARRQARADHHVDQGGDGSVPRHYPLFGWQL